MRRLIYIVIVMNFLLLCIPGKSYCYAADSNPEQNDSKLELDWDYLTHVHFNDRYIDTVSLHIFEKVSKKNNRSIYRGITITRPYGYLINTNQQTKDCSAVGVGPVYMIRNEKKVSGKLDAAFDMSGGVIVYDKKFPAGGECYNFMWQIGPRFIYKFSQNSSVNIGYMLMHVSNGLHYPNPNPSYNAHGVSFGFVTNF